jgi:hypothetical protein
MCKEGQFKDGQFFPLMMAMREGKATNRIQNE